MRKKALFPVLVLLITVVYVFSGVSQAQDKAEGSQPPSPQQSQEVQPQEAQPQEASSPSQQEAQPSSDPSKININTADSARLADLPGIGPAIAQAVIEHREAKGPFQSIEGILDVKGIGPKKFETIKDRITVE